METKLTIEKTQPKTYTCYKCNRQFVGANSLLSHMARKYKLSSEQVYREMNNILEDPLCACGCGISYRK